jgi:hypothetical protein
MNTEKWQTSVEEIANIVFNSADTELNDILRRIIDAGSCDVKGLFQQMTMRINTSVPYNLRTEAATDSDRHTFLREKIKLELTYCAIQLELV